MLQQALDEIEKLQEGKKVLEKSVEMMKKEVIRGKEETSVYRDQNKRLEKEIAEKENTVKKLEIDQKKSMGRKIGQKKNREPHPDKGERDDDIVQAED